MKKRLLMLLAALFFAACAVLYGHPRKVTRLWWAESAPPSPPGMGVVVHDGMPLPGGRIYVSPEELEEMNRKARGRKD